MSCITPLQVDMWASTLLNNECSKSHGGNDLAGIAIVGALDAQFAELSRANLKEVPPGGVNVIQHPSEW